MRRPFVCWHEIIQPEERKKFLNLYIRNTVENDFKKMKQYYGNENYIKLFVEEREREREREKRFENIFEWYVRPYLIVKHEMAQTQPTMKNFKCNMWYLT